MKKAYPILEFDPDRAALIEPGVGYEAADLPEACVVCFFQDEIEKLQGEGQAHVITHLVNEIGQFPVFVVEARGWRFALFHPGVGAPLAAACLEEVIALGCRKFMVCGGAGVLHPDLALGHPIVVSGAVRDEGTSYHYLPPGREVAAHPAGVAALERTLRRRDIPYVVGKTWTTDAFYRETRQKIRLRREERG